MRWRKTRKNQTRKPEIAVEVSLKHEYFPKTLSDSFRITSTLETDLDPDQCGASSSAKNVQNLVKMSMWCFLCCMTDIMTEISTQHHG